MTSPDEQGQQIQENASVLGRLARKYSKLDSNGGFAPVDASHITFTPPFNPQTGETTDGQPAPRRTVPMNNAGHFTGTGRPSQEELERKFPAMRGRVRPGDV